MRGARFKFSPFGDARPDYDDARKTWDALGDVAEWLGYGAAASYNLACEETPDEVRLRLAEAT